MRKLELELEIGFLKITEYRGVPLIEDESNRLPAAFVYGNLVITDDDRNEPFSSKWPKKYYKIRHYPKNTDYGLGEWKDIEVHPGSIGQKIYTKYYEGDVLEHPDYPGCLFEFTYNKTGWTPKVIYGTGGNMYLRDFPGDIEDYQVVGYTLQYPWYPKKKPRYRDPRGGIFLARRGNTDICYDSAFGNIGGIYEVSVGPEIRDLGAAESIEDPEITTLLVDRKLL